MRNKGLIIIIVMALIILSLSAFLLLNNPQSDKTNNLTVNHDNIISNIDNSHANNANNNKQITESDDISYNGWTYDKSEYTQESYNLDEVYTAHTPAYAVKQFFEDSDFDGDGRLRGREISAMDYKLKHSQYTYNGPYGYN